MESDQKIKIHRMW